MATLSDSTSRSQVVPGLALAVATLAVLTAVRLLGLKFSHVDLFVDEAQYWVWSREPAFGYFSKPPLLAWIIAGAEHICGSSQACVRAPAPVFYFATSLIVYAIAQQLYDARVAFFAALSTALATGVVFSARIISTDVPLLFFWALALLAYVKLVAGGNGRWAVVLGVSLGLGLMAKYAMIYFVLGVGLAAWLDADARRLLARPAPWLALLIAVLIVAPNLVWNVHNGLTTFKHTGDNIKGGGLEFNVWKGLEFILAQFLVFGPVVFAVLLGAVGRIAAPQTERADRLMLAFAIPPLVLVTVVGFVTRALANWAAPAAISATILVVAILIRREAWRWLAASLGIGLFAQALFLAGDTMAKRVHLPFMTNGDVYHRTLGGRALAEQAGALARRAGAKAIASDSRDDEAALLYYWRDRPEPVFAWPLTATPAHYFDVKHALTTAAPQPLLFVSRCDQSGRLAAQFASVQPLGSFNAPTGPTTALTYYAFKLDHPRGPIGPLGGCE
jgi:4-amino-4-deoxy-L-arabinose transferase-like glycosyltransferase